MSLYLYLGPDSAVTLRLPDGGERDVLLWSNQIVDLPPNHETTRVLLAKGWLHPAPAADAKPATKPGKAK